MDKLKERTGIYHEHQQGALCAQHALNNLLQAQMFLADALADIARELDADEKSVLTQTSFQSENMDDTGFFSIQVLQRALKIFEIELVPRGSQELIATQARNSPESIQAYICNLGLHWFTIRRFGKQYFDLNSLYYVPELISNMALLHYLKIIEDNGYSVFIVHGSLPVCVADQQLAINPISMSEYRSLTKDLPKYIMDDKIIENMKGLPRRKNGEIVVQLPRHLMEELKKNPDNPEIRELIYSQLPKGFLDKEMSGHAGCSDPNHHHPRPRLVITDIQDDLYDEQLMGVCDCPFHRQLSQGLSPHSKEQVINSPVTDKPNEHHDESQMITPYFTEKMTDDPNIFNLKERQHEPQMITERVTQLIVTQSNPNNPNEPPQQKVITKREVIVTSGSLQKNATLIDSQDVRQMTKPSIGAESDDDYLLQHVMAQSLLDTSEPNENINKFFFEEQSEQLYQQSLDKAIAASLATNNSTIEQAKETPELIPITNMNSSPTSTMDSQPVIIKMPSASTTPPSSNANSPSLTNTHSLPSIDTSSLPPTNTYSLSPTNTTSPPPTNMYSTPPTDKSSPPTMTITKNSPPPIVTDVDDVESPSVEELRQRRLQFYGNRDRSIISQQSDLND